MEGLAEGRVDLTEFTAVKRDVFADEIGGGTGATLCALWDRFDFLLGLILRVDTGTQDMEEVFLVLLHSLKRVRNKGLEF